jgi:hypothetical protein
MRLAALPCTGAAQQRRTRLKRRTDPQIASESPYTFILGTNFQPSKTSAARVPRAMALRVRMRRQWRA